jgi:dihydroorotate dehydrogenase
MPDWFYRTVSRPVLFRFSALTARNFALGLIGRLARLPLGGKAIDFLGHMRADARLRRSFLGIDFPTPIGLGPGLDTRAAALPALARFGFGFLEVGPVTVQGTTSACPMERQASQEAIWFPVPGESLSLKDAEPRLVEAARLGLPILLRLAGSAGADAAQSAEECREIVRALAPHVALFTLATLLPAMRQGWSSEQWTAHLRTILAGDDGMAVRPVLLTAPADADMTLAEPFLEAARKAGVRGFAVDGSMAADEGRLVGLPARDLARERVRWLRERFGSGALLIGCGGVHEPADALALRAEGADLVQVDSGLVYSGPGLPKRINEAFLFEAAKPRGPDTPAVRDCFRTPSPPPLSSAAGERGEVVKQPLNVERAAEMTWFWTALMGFGMFTGSILALVIAATRVVLPYDEAFVGMTRAELSLINPRLLAFMAHDRVSLAGAMVAIGVMYLGLSLFGVRRGLHWAQQTLFVSAFTGFATFFLFLGFGYLDTFHAFVTVVLLQLLLLGVHARLGAYVPATAPPLREDAAWRRGLWGQLLLILHGFALLGAGLAISLVGVTHVFVHEDLEFMQTTADALLAANPRLVPLIAHDRATFGGMLLASGWAFLLPALWGFRNGSAWLWWTTLLAGSAAYAAAIGVHFAVGYLNLMHLLPAFAGLGLFLVGLGLSRQYLCAQ